MDWNLKEYNKLHRLKKCFYILFVMQFPLFHHKSSIQIYHEYLDDSYMVSTLHSVITID